VKLGLELGMCGEVVEDVDEGRVGGVGACDLCEVVRCMCARANLGVVREEGARGMCVGRKMTYLHRHCIVDEAVTVDRPSRGRVFGTNDIAHNVWCLWLVLCEQTFVIQHLRPYGD
jgi:hypothetical protein